MSVEVPNPPLVVSPEINITAGDKVHFTLMDKRHFEGEIIHYTADEQFIRIKVVGRDAPVRVDLHTIKVMSFPRERRWTRNENLVCDSCIELTTETQKFEIIYKDGSRISGETLGIRTDKFGLHIFPTIGESAFMQTFSSFEAIKEYRVGDYLGEMLLKQNLVTQDDLNKAIQAQESQRNLPLGEYLVTKAVVTQEGLDKALARQKTMPNMRLGEILISEGLVSEQQLNTALGEQTKDRSRPLGQILIDQGIVTQEQVQKSLAKKLGIPFVNLREYQIAPAIIAKLPKVVVDKFKVIPIAMHEGRLVVATDNPMNWKALDAVKFNTGLIADAVLATDKDIDYAIQFYYSEKAILEDGELDNLETAASEFEFGAGDEEQDEAVADNLLVKMINKIILAAYKDNVSDIHIEPYPGKNKTIIRFRKDGSLMNYLELPAQYRNALVSRVKIMAHLDISERRKPQDGKIDFKKFGPANIELRVATLPTAGGLEDVVMRILAAGEPVPLAKLGLSTQNEEWVRSCATKPYGLFLVCGPTGSGKTTTLHSILGFINTEDRKIWTAEDPVEITQRGMRQVQVNPKIGLTFADAMRAFLRADPDVIMVGEMRDKETCHMGIEASLTGHMVFSTLHTNSAPESIIRLLDMGMDPFNFADALVAILAQRLGKRLCAACKQPYQPNKAELKELLDEYCHEIKGITVEQKQVLLDAWFEQYKDADGNLTLFKASGCEKCNNTGYAGRVGIHEMLVASDEIKKAIIEGKPVAEITELALKHGMRTLKQDGILKVLQGVTDISRVRAVCVK
ncbi:MAG: ATPase, T2SS/T4P/T4SS family [Pseudomonadota bacterium]